MKKYSVMIVEDEKDLAELTQEFLNQFEFECTIESDGNNAIKRIIAEQPDVVLLDLMLPDIDGMDICKAVKDIVTSKIVMLTARSETIDQVLGLEIGADDYISKPVEPRLLLAKLRAIARRESINDPAHKKPLTFGTVELNRYKREVMRDGSLVTLNTPEYELLTYLVDNAGCVINRDKIFKDLWGIEYDGQNRQVDIHISSLRGKLEANPEQPVLIKTVRAKGYVFTG